MLVNKQGHAQISSSILVSCSGNERNNPALITKTLAPHAPVQKQTNKNTPKFAANESLYYFPIQRHGTPVSHFYSKHTKGSSPHCIKALI